MLSCRELNKPGKTLLQKLKSLLLWFLSAAVILVILVVSTVMFVNRKDQEPSPAALSLKKIAASQATVADQDNAFVYAMGFLAPEDSDAGEIGSARVQWLRGFVAKANSEEFPKIPGEEGVLAKARSAEFRQLASVCKESNRACADAIERDPARIRGWASSESKMIDRYQGLLAFRQWRELWPSDLRALTPHFAEILDGQRLMLLKAWLMAGNGDAAGSKRLLERDLQFWRMTLAESTSLISKLIAASAIEQHFKMGNLVLRRLPPASVTRGIPEGWVEPITVRERSMMNVMANESAFSERYLGSALKSGAWFETDDETGSESLGTRLAARFLFQPQATVNINANRLHAVAELFERDYAVVPAAADDLQASKEFRQKEFTELGIYNFMGDLLANLSEPEMHVKYGFRIANLEGVRRISLLASQLRSIGVNEKDLPQSLYKSGLRDPFDGSPFNWDAKEKSLVFRQALSGKADLKVAY